MGLPPDRSLGDDWGMRAYCAHSLFGRQVPLLKSRSGAAQESNLPSRGLHDRTGFEDRLGHRAHAAPRARLAAARGLSQNALVADSAGEAVRVVALQQELGGLARDPERVAETGQRDRHELVQRLAPALIEL